MNELPIEINSSNYKLHQVFKMKYVIVLFAVIISTYALSAEQEWVRFKLEHDKQYQNRTEETFRFSIFQSNLRKIEEHNTLFEEGLSTFKMGVNKMADLTESEFLERLILSKKIKPVVWHPRKENEVSGDVPEEVDWTKMGAVTEVKDQGSCGSCWSFSATGALEGANFLKSGKLVSLSEQNLVDCATDQCLGCLGGWMDKAFDYIQKNGIMSEEDYPYQGRFNTCQFTPAKSVLKVKGYKYVNNGKEIDLQKAVAKQPVSVAIDATTNLQLYQSGILDDTTCRNSQDYLNHGVLVVGYGSSNGTEYWIIKNSWGTEWGMKGFFWLARNKNNQCGIATDAVYPEVY